MKNRRALTVVAGLSLVAITASLAPADAVTRTTRPRRPVTTKKAATTVAPVTTAAPATTAAPVAAKVQGITDKTIKIGLTGPYTGAAAVAGQGLRAGVQIAIDEVNAAGGIDGRQVELVALDDGFEIPKLVANMKRLISQDQVYAIVAAAGSQALPGSWPDVKESGIIVWGPVTPPDPKLPSVFILGPSRTEQTRVAVDFMCERNVKRFFLVGQTNNLGQEGKAGASVQVPKCPGMELVGEEYLEPTKTDGVSAAANKIVQARADGVMFVTDNTQAALTAKRLRELGSTALLVAENGAGGPGGTNTVGQAGDGADGFHATMAQDLPATEVTRGVIAWRALATKSGYPQAQNNFSLQTYGYTKVFLEVLKKVAATKDYSWANFSKVAESTRVDLDFLPPIICGPLPDGHACARGAGVAQYKNGRWDQIRDFKTPK
jgi:ABC-type branched-subunit amino acid transport system substrate-binding protein